MTNATLVEKGTMTMDGRDSWMLEQQAEALDAQASLLEYLGCDAVAGRLRQAAAVIRGEVPAACGESK